jgi:hypothetical protein
VVPTLEVELHPRVNSRGGAQAVLEGEWATIGCLRVVLNSCPLWGMKVFFTLAMSEPGKGRVLVVDGGGR